MGDCFLALGGPSLAEVKFQFYRQDELVPQDDVLLTNGYAIGDSMLLDNGSGTALKA